jgi:hypothetical protein
MGERSISLVPGKLQNASEAKGLCVHYTVILFMQVYLLNDL